MTATVEQGYRLRPEHDEHTQRIIAVTADDVEIVGAYRLNDFNAWHLYVTKLVVDALGLAQPHKAHVCSREDAGHWVDMIASLYARAVAA